MKIIHFADLHLGVENYGHTNPETGLSTRFEDFLKSIDCPTRLSELNIDDSQISKYAQETLRIIHDENGNLPGRPAMTEADIIAVLKAAL